MPDFEIIQVEERPYLYAERTCSMDPDEIGQNMGSAFQEVWSYMQSKAIKPTGGALSVYYEYDPSVMKFRAGFEIAREEMGKAGDSIKADVTPSGRVLHFVHKGSYATLRDDYDQMMRYLKDNTLDMVAPTWEVYLNDPYTVPEDELLTECFTKLG